MRKRLNCSHVFLISESILFQRPTGRSTVEGKYLSILFSLGREDMLIIEDIIGLSTKNK